MKMRIILINLFIGFVLFYKNSSSQTLIDSKNTFIFKLHLILMIMYRIGVGHTGSYGITKLKITGLFVLWKNGS